VNVRVNGEPQTVDEPITVGEYLRSKGLDPVRLVVEINRNIVKRETFDTTGLGEGDRIEILHFVGGG
jgi:thiamine biosynthesis protein ThiS